MPKPVHLTPLSTVTPAPHQRFNCADKGIAAITVWTGWKYITVNNPVQVFFPHTGGLTVQGPYGHGTTVKSDADTACIVTVLYDDASATTPNTIHRSPKDYDGIVL